MSRAIAENEESGLVSARFMLRLFFIFAGLAILALIASLAGKSLGASIALAGHTDDPTPREIVIGNNVIVAPSNAIRFERARRDGVAARLDLYFRWPALDGYSEAARDDFNHAHGERNIVFMGFEPRMMSRDMSGRFEPIYSALVVKPGHEGPGGLTIYEFAEKSGYLNEILVTAPRRGTTPFVARCLTGPAASESLAPCERDVEVGSDLSLTYRFPRELLSSWQKLDAAIAAKAGEMLKTAR